jgi:hypothetical protein
VSEMVKGGFVDISQTPLCAEPLQVSNCSFVYISLTSTLSRQHLHGYEDHAKNV